MAKIVCKKCGLGGFSKCPHCRSVFADHSSPSTEVFEFQGFVKKADPEKEVDDDGKHKWLVGMWTFAATEDEAMKRALTNFKSMLADPEFNINIAACAHEWDFAEGAISEIGCGCATAIIK